jgi:hypothetical protein
VSPQLYPGQPPIRWLPEAIFPRVNRPGHAEVYPPHHTALWRSSK